MIFTFPDIVVSLFTQLRRVTNLRRLYWFLFWVLVLTWFFGVLHIILVARIIASHLLVPKFKNR